MEVSIEIAQGCSQRNVGFSISISLAEHDSI